MTGSGTTRRPRRLLRLALATGGVLLAGFVALAVTAAYRPLPLDLLQSATEERLSRQVAPLRLSAGRLWGQWHPAGPSLTLRAEQLILSDQAGRTLATAPVAEASLSLGALLRGDALFTDMCLERPSFAITRSDDGAVRVGLGLADPALDRLPFAASRLQALGELLFSHGDEDRPLPEMTVEDGVASYRDEATGTWLRFADLNINAKAAAEGPQARLSLVLLVGDQRLGFAAQLRRDPSEGGLMLMLSPDGVRPAILSEVLPGSGYLAPFEVPISGLVKARFDENQALLGLEFDLFGGPGSLEVADYNASNLYVDSLRLRGSYDPRAQRLELTSGTLDLANAKVHFGGSLQESGGRLILALAAQLFGGELSQLMPRWFAGLRGVLNVDEKMQVGSSETHLSLEGSIQPSRRLITVSGTIQLWGAATAGEFGDAGDAAPLRSLGFRLEGPLAAPRLMIKAPEP